MELTGRLGIQKPLWAFVPRINRLNRLYSSFLVPVKEVRPRQDAWATGVIKETGITVTVTDLFATSQADLLKDSEAAASASQAIKEAVTHKYLWRTRRKQGSRKVGASLQSFATNFAAFLQSYSGIVEMVKAGDNQYGGLAYGTLSLLLSVSDSS